MTKPFNLIIQMITPYRVSLAVYLLIACHVLVSAQLIPGDRRIQWTPGVPAGIPQVDWPEVNVLDFGADPGGSLDSYLAIIEAINSLPKTGGILFFPAGNYRINSTLRIERSHVILRGEGRDVTKLFSYAEGTCIEVMRSLQSDWQNLSGDHTLHSKRVRVEDGSLFHVGGFAEIRQENDSSIMYTAPKWDQEWSRNAVGQCFEITSIQGNEILFKTALHHSFNPALNPVISPQDPVQYVGFENFYIEKRVPKDHTFHFANAAYCWMKGLETYHTRRSSVRTNNVLGIEIRECFMHRSFHYGDGGSGYGVDCGEHSTDCLIENCVFDSLRHAILVQVGANGNVFGYNFSTNPVQGDGEKNLNQGWIPPDISVHGHYPYMNLFESNDVWEIGIADYWGPAGKGNTYFRNKVNAEGILYYDYSHYQNVIGNVTTLIDHTDGHSRYFLEHGNQIGSEVIWNDTIPERSLPDSYYRKAKPDFLNAYSWPVFGPDVAPGNKLPAKAWYESWLEEIPNP